MAIGAAESDLQRGQGPVAYDVQLTAAGIELLRQSMLAHVEHEPADGGIHHCSHSLRLCLSAALLHYLQYFTAVHCGRNIACLETQSAKLAARLSDRNTSVDEQLCGQF